MRSGLSAHSTSSGSGPAEPPRDTVEEVGYHYFWSFAGAAAMLALSRHIPRTRRRERAASLAIGVVLLGLGLTMYARAPPPATSELEPSVRVTPSFIETEALPSLRLEAPPGWRLQLEPETRVLTVTGSSATATVFTRRRQSSIDFATEQAKLWDELHAPGPAASSELIGGQVAVHAESSDGSVATWAIARDSERITIVQCRGAAAGTACRPVLERLVWIGGS